MEPNPTRGTGDRDQECSNYGACLSKAVKQNWPAWNCEECDIAYTGLELEPDEDKDMADEDVCSECGAVAKLEMGLCPECLERRDKSGGKAPKSSKPEMKSDVRICDECGERPTIRPNQPFCAKCLGARANKSRKSKAEAKPKQAPGAPRTAQDGPKALPPEVNPQPGRGMVDLSCEHYVSCRSKMEPGAGHHCLKCQLFKNKVGLWLEMVPQKAASPSTTAAVASSNSSGHEGVDLSNSAVMVDFSGHTELLEATKDRAGEEVRSLEHQIIFMVKTAMSESG